MVCKRCVAADGRRNIMKAYVIVKCTELNDQYECDADRTPILVLTNTNSDGLKNSNAMAMKYMSLLETEVLNEFKNIMTMSRRQTDEKVL